MVTKPVQIYARKLSGNSFRNKFLVGAVVVRASEKVEFCDFVSIETVCLLGPSTAQLQLPKAEAGGCCVLRS